MIRAAQPLPLLLAGVLVVGVSGPSGGTVDTQHLVVSDATGTLSSDQLRVLAADAQATLQRVLAFWAADPGVDRFGKIQVIFDAPRRDFYSSVFYWETQNGRRVRIVRVFKAEGPAQMLAHKLTSAVFPQKDKLIRNLMGILTEAHVGNPLTFPACGFRSDDWVLALRAANAYITLNELGPDHESWGMRDAGGGKLSVFDKSRQHRAYAEAGSWGNYLFDTYGVEKLKRLQRLSQEKERPWLEVFGVGLRELEANWLKRVDTNRDTRAQQVSNVSKLLERNPGTACAEAQKIAPTSGSSPHSAFE